MLAQPIAFPQSTPSEYVPLSEEPVFEPSRHLALERPATILRLADFGYEQDAIARCASDLVMTSPFRLMSDEGARALQDVALALKSQRFTTNRTGANRLKSNIRGAGYRSRFIRDFVTCPLVVDFLSEIADTPLVSHSMPSVQASINFAPDDVTKIVDSWHVDSIGFDFVMMVTDPARFEGGKFEYFRGTKAEGARLLGTTPERLTDGHSQDLPPDRVATVAFPGPGYAFFMQGHMVLHRATRLLRPAERITFVPGYVSRDLRYPDPTNALSMRMWSDPGMLAELARHKAWVSQSRLEQVIAELPLTADKAAICSALRAAIKDVETVIEALESMPGPKPSTLQ